MFAMLCTSGWAFAQTSLAQRIDLTLVDNLSSYTTAGELNLYENTLRIDQPSGSDKLKAGMLNEGDNMIVFSRQGNNEATRTEFARINLSAVKKAPRAELINTLDFYRDGNSAPANSMYVTNEMLAGLSPYWSTSANNQGLVLQSNGYAYSRALDGLVFTVPPGYSNATIEMLIMVGPDVAYGEFAFQVNSDGWFIGVDAEDGNVSTQVFTGINSGDIISILGGNSAQGQLTPSPDIAWIEVVSMPDSYIPTVEVTPTISYKDGDNWGTPASLGNSVTYTVNDDINLNGLGNITDRFSESTADNNHPESYSYNASLDANVVWTLSGDPNFYASVDFTTQEVTGDGVWQMNESNIYLINQNIIAAIIDYLGDILFIMPNTFAGSQVNVTVTSCPGTYGARDLYVNGVPHTFTSASSHTWTVDVAANGAIEFTAPENTFSVGISSIVISSPNASPLNAAHPGDGTVKKLPHNVKRGHFKEALRYKERKNNVKINDLNIILK